MPGVDVAGAAPAGAVVPWCNRADLIGPCVDVDLTDAQIDAAIILASEVLYNLTGRRWPGVRDDYVRPNYSLCQHSSQARLGFWSSAEALGPVVVFGGAVHRCGIVSEVQLGGYPLVEIVEVKVDGEVIDPALYRIDNHRTLVRLYDPDGRRRLWPSCQDHTRPDTELDTFSVAYRYGAAPPAGGVTVAGILSCEMAIALLPEGEGPSCRLSRAFTQITRAGVSKSSSSADTLAALGMTGLPEVDLWLSALTKGDSRRRAAVLSPGAARRVRRPGT